MTVSLIGRCAKVVPGKPTAKSNKPMPTKKPQPNRVNVHGLGQLYRRKEGGAWHMSFSIKGQQYRESTHTAKYAEALQSLKRRLSQGHEGQLTTLKVEKTRVSELLADVAQDYKLKGRVVSLRKMINPLIQHHLDPYFGPMRASGVTGAHLRAYVGHRQGEGAMPASINRELAILRRAYNLGTGTGKVNRGAVPDFSNVLLPELNARQGFWTHAEYMQFRDALPEDERAVFVFGYWTGCRYGEIIAITWDQVDLSGRTVRLREDQTKAKEPRMIPLAGDLLSMLQAQHARHQTICPKSPWVFFRTGAVTKKASVRRGQQIKVIDKPWDRAMEQTGIKRLFHDLRRTGVRNLIRAGVPQKVAMRISGHKTDAVFARYNIVDERDLHDAADKLAKHLEGKEG
jgi:integrase